MKLHKKPFLLKECKIELTHKCPLACIHCSSDAFPDSTVEIQRDKCFEIIDQAKDLGIKKLSLSGGEPLLWDGLEDVVKLASDNGIDVIVYSSGNVSNLKDKMEELVSAGVSKIVYSIFGGTSASHARVTRIQNSFDLTIRAVKSAKDVGLQVEFHFVPFSINYRELPDILKLSKSLGVETISILRFVPQGRGYLVRNYLLNRLQNIELKNVIESARSKGFNIRTGSPFNFLLLNDQPECASGIDRVIISPDLKIYPCDAFKQIQAEEVVDDIKFSSLDQWPLKKCWEKSPFFEAIRNHLVTDFEKPCSVCSELESCLSGCLAQKVLHSGDLRKQPDPMCIMNKAI